MNFKGKIWGKILSDLIYKHSVICVSTFVFVFSDS
jgi:hypothetical protein